MKAVRRLRNFAMRTWAIWDRNMQAKAPEHASLKERALKEFRIFWIITLYLALFLGSFTVYRRLILKEFGVAYLHYGFALIEALIIAKVILIGQAFGVAKRFERGPLILSVLYKSILFGLLVFLFGILERVVEGLIHQRDWAGILQGVTDLGLYELLARTVMLIVAFVPFFAFWEIGRVLGPGRLSALFFSSQGAASSSDPRD
jgi:hypothetical protein